MLSINDQFTRLPERLLCFWIGYQMLVRHRQISLVLPFSFGVAKTSTSQIRFADGTYEGEIIKDGQKTELASTAGWTDPFMRANIRTTKTWQGKISWANGESYKGAYVLDERTGKGSTWPDGSFTKEIFSRKKTWMGQFQSTDKVVYTGEWFDDLQHGQGTLTYPDGRILKGIWRKGNLLSKPAVKPRLHLNLYSSGFSGLEEEKKSCPKPPPKLEKMAPQSRAQQINAIPSQFRMSCSAPKTVPSVELVEPQVDSIPEDSISQEFIPLILAIYLNLLKKKSKRKFCKDWQHLWNQYHPTGLVLSLKLKQCL